MLAAAAAQAHCSLLPALIGCAIPLDAAGGSAPPTRLMAEAADCAVHLSVKFTDLGYAPQLAVYATLCLGGGLFSFFAFRFLLFFGGVFVFLNPIFSRLNHLSFFMKCV